MEETKILCPECENEIDHLKYVSNVREYGSFNINLDEEDEELSEGDFNHEDSETQDTETECPSCGANIGVNECIIKKPKQKKRKKIKYIEGNEVMYTLWGGEKVKAVITNIEKRKIKIKVTQEGPSKGNTYTVREHQIEKLDKSKEIDNGDSETEEKIIHKKEDPEGTYKIDPLLRYTSICPKCSYLFAETDPLSITNIRTRIEPAYAPFDTDEGTIPTTTCPKCTHEFNRVKTQQKQLSEK